MWSHLQFEFTATHTVECFGDIIDVCLLAYCEGGAPIWVDKTGYPHFTLERAVPIPGRAEAHASREQRSRWIKPVSLVVGVSRDVCAALLGWNWTPSSMVHRVKYDCCTGRICRSNGEHWVLRGNAETVLRSLNLGDSHRVDGFGNDGPRGREWWITPKSAHLTLSRCRLLQDNDPLDGRYRYTIELGADGSTGEEGLMCDLRYMRKEWGMRVVERDESACCGFDGSGAYHTFIREVLVGRDGGWQFDSGLHAREGDPAGLLVA